MLKFSAVAVFASTAFFTDMVFAGCNEVSFISFGIELYTPESEATIMSRSQKTLYATASVYNNVFWAAYKKDNDVNYDPNNVRSVIKGDKGLVYIDRFGKVRVGDRYGEIDAAGFEKKLVPECEE